MLDNDEVDKLINQQECRVKTLIDCGVYQIRNIINNNIYIGSSISIKKRFSAHKNDLRKNQHYNSHLQRAWNKYGEENFEFNIIENSIYPEERLQRENYYIRVCKPEYNNIKVNDEGCPFYSDESKNKIRNNRIGKRHSEESKIKIGNASRGRKWTEESKQKYKETRKLRNYKHSDDVLKLIGIKNKGRVRSPEELQKQRDSHLGKKMSKESILKMIETRKRNNKPRTEEHRKHLSEALKGRKRPYGTYFIKVYNNRKVIDINTNEIFDSIKDAAIKNNMTSYNLRNRLVGIVINNTSLKFFDNV